MTIYEDLPAVLLEPVLHDIEKERTVVQFKLDVINESIQQLRIQIKLRGRIAMIAARRKHGRE